MSTLLLNFIRNLTDILAAFYSCLIKTNVKCGKDVCKITNGIGVSMDICSCSAFIRKTFKKYSFKFILKKYVFKHFKKVTHRTTNWREN